MTRTIKLPDFISKVIVIHLNRATDRKPHLEKLAELFANYDFEVFPAVDARELTEHEKGEKYIRNLFDPRYPFPLSDTEIACFFSHRTVWEVIRSEVNGATLVLEDDVDFETAKFSNAIAALTEGSIKETYIRLPCKKPATLPKTASAELRTPKEVGLGMQAQVITPCVAEELLKFTERFDRPVDTALQMRWEHRIRTAEIWPNGVREIDFMLGGTTIQEKKKSPWERLVRELKRFAYRRAVSQLSNANGMR